MINHGINE